MKLTNFEKVCEFHKAFDLPVLETPQFPSNERIDLRLRLHDEEYGDELQEALAARDIVATADALTDIAYVVYGMAAEFGIDLDACFDEVHRSNMSKLGADGRPIHREDGKVVKGPNYTPPDLRKVLGVN